MSNLNAEITFPESLFSPAEARSIAALSNDIESFFDTSKNTPFSQVQRLVQSVEAAFEKHAKNPLVADNDNVERARFLRKKLQVNRLKTHFQERQSALQLLNPPEGVIELSTQRFQETADQRVRNAQNLYFEYKKPTTDENEKKRLEKMFAVIRKSMLNDEKTIQIEQLKLLFQALGLTSTDFNAEERAVGETMNIVDDYFGHLHEGFAVEHVYPLDPNRQQKAQALYANYLFWYRLIEKIKEEGPRALEEVFANDGEIIPFQTTDFSGKDITISFSKDGIASLGENQEKMKDLDVFKNASGVVARQIMNYGFSLGLTKAEVTDFFSLSTQEKVIDVMGIISSLVYELQPDNTASTTGSSLAARLSRAKQFRSLNEKYQKLVLVAVESANGSWKVGVGDEAIHHLRHGNLDKAQARLTKQSFTAFTYMMKKMGWEEIFKDFVQVSQGMALLAQEEALAADADAFRTEFNKVIAD